MKDELTDIESKTDDVNSGWMRKSSSSNVIPPVNPSSEENPVISRDDITADGDETSHYVGSVHNQKMAWYDAVFNELYDDVVTIINKKSIAKDGSGRMEFSYGYIVKAMSAIEKLVAYYNSIERLCNKVGPTDTEYGSTAGSGTKELSSIDSKHPNVRIPNTNRSLYKGFKNIAESYDPKTNEVFISEEENQLLMNLGRTNSEEIKTASAKIFRVEKQDVLDYISNYKTANSPEPKEDEEQESSSEINEIND